MYAILELKRRLTKEETKQVQKETGYALDEELDRSHDCYSDLEYNFLQFVGLSDDYCQRYGIGDNEQLKAAEECLQVLKKMDLPVVDMYIDY